MTRRIDLVPFLLLLGLLFATGARGAVELAPAPPGDPVEVEFRLNDAFVKDRMLPGVTIGLAVESRGTPFATAITDATGAARLRVPPGSWFASYTLAGYVPIEASETSVTAEGQVVTTTLSMLLESEGRPIDERRVRIILNWGSDQSQQIRDADSHLYCACRTASPHVSYRSLEHQGAMHKVALDVDDTDWGGPETVTLTNPPPGDYAYWVHNFSGGPGTVGASQVVVRVLVGDTVVNELHPPGDTASDVWRPFDVLRVRPDLGVEIVPFTAEQLTQGAAGTLPADLEVERYTVVPDQERAAARRSPAPPSMKRWILLVVVGAIFAFRAFRRLSRSFRGNDPRRR